MVRMTKATRQILYFIEQNGFITNNICSRIFYKGKSNGYTQAQVKLKSLFDNKRLKRYEHPYTKEYIYQFNTKRIDDHKKYICDLYSRIYEIADEIVFAKLNEQTWSSVSRRNDAHIIYRIKDRVVGLLIEFDKFHKTSYEKLNEIYESNEVQEWYESNYKVENYFPTILIITPTAQIDFKSDKWTCLAINYDFDGLKDIL